jgi:glutamate--cysteine ligase
MPALMSAAIDRRFEQTLAALINSGEPSIIRGGRKGLEKESLRVTPDGRIAQTPHPRALGSALTNENITTDYSEALFELVTPTVTTSWELLQYLTDLHQFVYQHMDDELLWATSMPSIIEGDASIPIAQYGKSNVGRMKTVYRNGLGNRYGRVMQAISGVHYNYSFPQAMWDPWAELMQSRERGQPFISDRYFHLLRNYRRHGWIVLYLFGVSPVVCNSFLRGRDVTLPRLSKDTSYEPYATSLRMSDLGYRNRNQAGLSVSVNSVNVDGEWRQLNANILQIENEYYSFIRPKRVARSGERPTKALLRAGVEYVEVRALDVSAFDPVGVNQNKLRFLEMFLALCLMKESDPIGDSESDLLDANHVIVARRGREPGLTLQREGRSVSLLSWARELLDSMQGIAEVFDSGDQARPYSAALAVQAAKVEDVSRTPSARMLRELESTGESFFDLALRMSRLHKEYFLALYQPNVQRQAEFAAAAEESLRAQTAIEARDGLSFDQYLSEYAAA